MQADEEVLDREAESVINRNCVRPFEVLPGVFVRCRTRVKSKCPSCAELYRGDWAAIARSGVFDGPVENFRFYLLTLTAPSFGRVHLVPRTLTASARACVCGVTHSPKDSGLRGVPIDPSTYDYAGQVAWNRDAGVLWDRTRRRVRDRWDSLEYFIVREWQDRGVLHAHVVMRIARKEAPDAETLGAAARTAVAASRIDGTLVEWGKQTRCDAFKADGDGARTIWYLSKALNYVMKDTARGELGGRNDSWSHLAKLDAAARRMRCSLDCIPSNCTRTVHNRHGSRSHVVSASRRTKNRTGWSFTGLNRTVQRRLRKEWFDAQAAPAEPPTEADRARVEWAQERLAARARREMDARAAAVP